MTEPRLRAVPPPKEGLRIDAMAAPDGVTVSSACRHLTMVAAVGERVTPERLIEVARNVTAHGCRAISVVYQWAPARLAERSRAIPIAPGMAAAIASFLADNPPEACGCDPDVSMTMDENAPISLRLEHEAGCPGIDRPANGWGTYVTPGATD